MSHHPNNQIHSAKPELSGLKNHNKNLSDYDSAWSPTSPLDLKMFSTFVNPFGGGGSTPKGYCDSGKVGLSLVESLDDHDDSSRLLNPSPESKNIIFSSRMRAENPNCQKNNTYEVTKISSGSLVETDIEISEYCCGDKKESLFVIAPIEFTTPIDVLLLPSNEFLSFCCYCSKKLEMGKDIYMYRGDKPFCSSECRSEEIDKDEDSSYHNDLPKKKSNSVIFTIG